MPYKDAPPEPLPPLEKKKPADPEEPPEWRVWPENPNFEVDRSGRLRTRGYLPPG